MIAKALLKREKSAHISACAKTQLYFKSVQRQLRGESITYLLLQGWQLVPRITLSSVSCTCTIEVSLLASAWEKINIKNHKINHTVTNTSAHGFVCSDTCAHTQTELRVLFFCRTPRGFMMSCVHASSGPRVVATACKAPGRTDRRAKTGYFAKLRWRNRVPSCSMATHQALRSQHCWGKN